MMQSASVRRARLEQLEKDCAAIESDIRSLEAQIKVPKSLLEAKHREMALLAPVYTLPDDIAALILKVAYQHHFPHCRLDDGLPHTNSPVSICHVSRWWRHQALSVSVYLVLYPCYPRTART